VEKGMTDRESRKQQIGAKRQEQILNAATEIFVRKGYTDATIPEIAKLSGLAVGTIYIYYPSKRELFIAAVEKLIMDPIADIFAKKANEEYPNILKDAITNRMGFLQGDTMVHLLALLGDIQRDAKLRTIFAEKLMKPFLGRMENIYRVRMESGEFRKLEPAIIVRLIGGMMIGMSLLRMAEGETSPLNRIPPKQLDDEIMNFILFGLKKG